MLSWLNEDLRKKIRNIFESLNNKALTEKEIDGIAENLTGYMETVIKFKLRYENKQNIA